MTDTPNLETELALHRGIAAEPPVSAGTGGRPRFERALDRHGEPIYVYWGEYNDMHFGDMGERWIWCDAGFPGSQAVYIESEPIAGAGRGGRERPDLGERVREAFSFYDGPSARMMYVSAAVDIAVDVAAAAVAAEYQRCAALVEATADAGHDRHIEWGNVGDEGYDRGWIDAMSAALAALAPTGTDHA